MNDYVRPARHALAGFDQIELPDTSRPYVPEEVVKLKASIEAIGLQTPLTVVKRGARYHLLAGRHRLEALRLLKVDRIPVRIVDMTDVEARMWTISENLHRAELTVMQRAQQIAEWVKLAQGRRAEVSSQLETKPQGGRPEGGVNAAARGLGVGKMEAHRAMKIDAIVPAAKEALREAKLDNNQGVVLKVASYADDDQVEAVAEIVADREAKAKAPPDVAERAKLLCERAEKMGYRIARRGSNYRLIGNNQEMEVEDLDEVEAMLDTAEGQRAMRITSPCGAIVYSDNSEAWLAAHPGATLEDFKRELPPAPSACATRPVETNVEFETVDDDDDASDVEYALDEINDRLLKMSDRGLLDLSRKIHCLVSDRIVEVGRWVWQYKQGVSLCYPERNDYGEVKPDEETRTKESVQVIGAAAISKHVAAVAIARGGWLGPLSVTAFCRWATSQAAPAAEVEAFFTPFINGNMLEPDSPLVVAREQVVHDAMQRRRYEPGRHAEMILRAWINCQKGIRSKIKLTGKLPTVTELAASGQGRPLTGVAGPG